MVKMIQHPADMGQSQFPRKVKVVQWCEEDFTDVEEKEINSILELNALLQEVKQFNDDSHNKEGGVYKTIITN